MNPDRYQDLKEQYREERQRGEHADENNEPKHRVNPNEMFMDEPPWRD